MGEVLTEDDDDFLWVVDAEAVTMVLGLTRSFVCIGLVRPLTGQARARFF